MRYVTFGALNRNVLDHAMFVALRRVVEAAVPDDLVFAIVITGARRAFCAGIDVSLLQRAASDAERSAAGAERTAAGVPGPTEGPVLFAFPLRVPKPVIAAVNGVAAGGGFVLAMMCDLRFVASDASFTTVFSRRGLIAEYGTSWLLPRQLGTSRALDLLWSSRRVGADARDFLVASVESAALMNAALAHPDTTEGAMSFVERRAPRFRSLTEREA